MVQKIKMSRGITLTFEEGCKKYLENCRQRNLREGTINHYTLTERVLSLISTMPVKYTERGEVVLLFLRLISVLYYKELDHRGQALLTLIT